MSMKRFSIGSKYEYCPNGNYWQEISGIFDKQIYLFCDCNKCKGQVYVLKPFNITKKVANEDIINRARKMNRLDDVRLEITTENMEEVMDLIENKKL